MHSEDPLEEAGADVNSRTATGILLLIIAGLIALGIFVPGSRTALALILGIILLIMLHEFGHYWTAKRAGMKVTEFFVGFGPRLWSFRRGETEYGVKAIPAGGYVRIIGMTNMEEVDPEDEPRTYRQATTGKRLMVILAGVTVNLFIAFLLFFVVIAGQGRIADGPSTTVSRVVAGSAAQDAGLKAGDKIVAADGTAVAGNWDALKAVIEKNGGQPISITVERNGSTVELTATPKEQDGQGFLGVGPTTAFKDVGVLAAIPQSFTTIGNVTEATWNGLVDRFSPSGVQQTAKQSFTSAAPAAGSTEDQNRPQTVIGFVNNGSQIADGNVWSILWLLAALSLVLAIFNLIPLLPLDGGHAVIAVYEGVASKVKHRRVFADYRKALSVSLLLLSPLLFLSLSAMVLDIRQLGS
ncbi:MAG: M50 family metallopeptidase [Acidimicrobiia bacterium]